jgi:hypothetical protein
MHDSRIRGGRFRGAVIAAVMIFGLAVTGCSSSAATAAAGTSPHASMSGAATSTLACAHVGSVKFAKTKFVLHAGLGAGAFYKFLYKPFKNGKFKKGAKGRIKSMLIGGGAALFTLHELKQAKKAAEGNKTLCKLVAPINSLAAKLSGLGSGLKSGKLNTSAIDKAGTDFSSFTSKSGNLGAQIKQIAPASVSSFTG